ncbi:MAG TPA: Gfo/Idh/MocA family oxidoreductase [Pirellulaceae bacterium]|jgi:predicted dehydrogenase|nr:Gfo/Idh/MocA family oxidoreductase [Pirellulaceae bacterium]
MKKPINRRSFLATAGVTATMALGRRAVAGANSRIRCGIIGVGRRGTHLLRLALSVPQVQITAVCDIQPAHLERGREMVAKAGQARPAGFGQRSPKDYLRMLEGNDLDAVIIATPMQDHGVMAIDALQADKAVLSEVAACMTLDECWGLVRAVEASGSFYMLAENVCYFRDCMAVMNMARQGLFGGITYAECGYVHDCRFLHFDPDGSLNWRGQLARDYVGNLYPTHAIGPVAQWMGINKSDRLESLVSMTSRSFGAHNNASKKYGPESPQSRIAFSKGDTTTTMIQTANGAVIDLRYDTTSSRPHRTTVYHTLQGETASYRSLTGDVWIESKSEGYRWEPLTRHMAEFDDSLWKQSQDQAASSGHGGADFFVINEFFAALRDGRPSPIDVYDAVTWSSVIPLSAASIRQGNARIEVPDFTQGRGKPNRSATN